MQPSSSSQARESWSLFSKRFGAEHICEGLPYWSNNNDKVVHAHQQAKITMDCHSHVGGKVIQTVTRVYVPLEVQDDFRFGIYPSNFVEEIGKFFGMQDIESGHADFDDKLIIKSGNEVKLRLFLSDREIRDQISAAVLGGHFCSTYSLERIKMGAPGERIYLSFFEPGVVCDAERIETIFRLIISSRQRLKDLGFASDRH